VLEWPYLYQLTYEIQEKTYNPYYTLVCQQLCQKSHSFKITLQFVLWDFIRDLGDAGVGGAAVMKHVQDDEGFGLNKISDTRMRSVAKAYGWWVAKDSVTLGILKVVLSRSGAF
jgi:nucleolar MIF4G domain-containing protein 1